MSGLDARLARLAAARLDAQRVAADADAENALAALRVVLALPDSTVLRLVDPLAALPADSGSAAAALDTRGDLDALDQGLRAADLGVRRAWAANLPSLALFGNLAQHSHVGPGNTGSGDWTIGLGLQWRPFAGLSGAGAVARARAERDATAARRAAALHQARFEVAQSERLHAAARLRMSVAQAARGEAVEALEQAALRYRTGTTLVTELLDVQTALTNASLDLLAARHDVLVTAALHDFASGVFDR